MSFTQDVESQDVMPEELAMAEQQRANEAEALLARYRERFGEFLDD